MKMWFQVSSCEHKFSSTDLLRDQQQSTIDPQAVSLQKVKLFLPIGKVRKPRAQYSTELFTCPYGETNS